MNHADLKQAFESSLIIVKVVVMESPDKKNLENPGGSALMEALGGKGAGLPYHAILDSKGKLIINSKRVTKEKPDGANIGHPYAKEEVDHFMSMLRKGAPKMTSSWLGKVETHLRNQGGK